MSLGYKCAEVICSVLMDPDFYVSHLDLRKNPICDDGAIVLMHAIKRSNTIIFLDLSSCLLTAKGATRIIRSLRFNESL
jgi:Ran GTPase-activating protein (RanGAP) involved in mRNA processing and transport